MTSISPEAEKVLFEIIDHETDDEYWKNRFEGISVREDVILRGCFKELRDNELVDVRYADNYPYSISILKDGYLYEQHRLEALSPIEKNLQKLIKKAEEIKDSGDETEKKKQITEEWMNDVQIFLDRYLQNHSLKNRIWTLLFHRGATAFDELIACLKSISKDEDFIREMGSEKTDFTKRTSENNYLEYDVFISHASADKADIIDELYESLSNLGVKIFYDKESIEWGDKWKEKIIQGTQSAEFAIIVISESFFGREWTELELNKFLNRQNQNGQKIILPILHGITSKQLEEKYPAVADIQAISSDKYSCDQIAMMFAKQFIKRLKGI